MKKTISISLGGRAFIFEEDAYNMLKNYLDDIQSRLCGGEGASEIYSDIENRVSEILSSKISAITQVVNLAMVHNIMSTIGAPHYFGENKEKKSYDTPPPHYRVVEVERRFMRDPNRRVLGGVCAGIASYMSTDVTLIRILSLILFFCVGFGLIPYLILWLVVPKARTQAEIDMLNRGYYN